LEGYNIGVIEKIKFFGYINNSDNTNELTLTGVVGMFPLISGKYNLILIEYKRMYNLTMTFVSLPVVQEGLNIARRIVGLENSRA
jgi:hypothetical protein